VKPLLEVLQSSAEWLRGRGTESPRLNAEHLLAQVLGKRRLDLYLEFDRPLGEAELTPLRDLLRRRATGEPLQHLLGTAEFCGRTFACDPRALIPRPETEELVERVSARLTGGGLAGPLVDVGTGSGVIALSLALLFPDIEVIGVDLSAEALVLAGENAARHSLAGRVGFVQSDLLEAVPGPFGAVIANLPYIAASDIAGLSPEVRRDPRLALDGGADGLTVIGHFIPQAGVKLASGGLLALEIGDGQGEALKGLLGGDSWRNVEVQRDLQGRERFVFATHG